MLKGFKDDRTSLYSLIFANIDSEFKVSRDPLAYMLTGLPARADDSEITDLRAVLFGEFGGFSGLRRYSSTSLWDASTI
jgi:hypothetical protein